MSPQKPLPILLQIIDRLLLIYQLTISPDHGFLKPLFPFGVCRYHTTCSQFARQAIREYQWRGLIMAVGRLLHCHPFARQGEHGHQ